MQNILKISEAVSLGMHAATFMAVDSSKVYANSNIAKALKVSEAHLSKVLQRLVKAGIMKSIRGPAGGFVLINKDASLLAIYEAIEGPLRTADCLFDERICGSRFCILGNLITEISEKIRDYLSRTKLSELAHVYGRKEDHD